MSYMETIPKPPGSKLELYLLLCCLFWSVGSIVSAILSNTLHKDPPDGKKCIRKDVNAIVAMGATSFIYIILIMLMIMLIYGSIKSSNAENFGNRYNIYSKIDDTKSVSKIATLVTICFCVGWSISNSLLSYKYDQDSNTPECAEISHVQRDRLGFFGFSIPMLLGTVSMIIMIVTT